MSQDIESECSDDEQFDCEAEAMETYPMVESVLPGESNRGQLETSEYQGKRIKWSSVPLATHEESEYACEIENENDHIQFRGEEIQLALDVFSQFYSPEVKSLILKYTNIRMKKEYPKSTNRTKTQFIYGRDIDAYMSILIATNYLRDNEKTVEDIFSEDVFRTPIYSSIISRDKFTWIRKCIRFDDKDTRVQGDKEAPVKQLHKLLNDTFDLKFKHFLSGKQFTVDERIVKFRGRCGHKVYMPSKPDSYGLKLWMLVDTNYFYVRNFSLYLGKENNLVHKNLACDVVINLAKSLDPGCQITTDNYFTSYDLAQKLLSRRITLLGTIRQNRKEVPRSLRATKDKEPYSTIHRFNGRVQLTSYVPKKSKVVILLSSLSPDTAIDASDERKKPNIIKNYNKQKCGVDVVDAMISHHSCSRKTRRWPQALFHNHVDFMLHNSFIVYKKHVDHFISKKKFCKMLVLALAKAHMNNRLENSIGLSKNTIEMIRLTLSYSEATASDNSNEVDETGSGSDSPIGQVRKKIKTCHEKRCPKRTSLDCFKCHKYACKAHTNKFYLCSSCASCDSE